MRDLSFNDLLNIKRKQNINQSSNYISKEFYEQIKADIPNGEECENLFGITFVVSDLYPIKLLDGTLVIGSMQEVNSDGIPGKIVLLTQSNENRKE